MEFGFNMLNNACYFFSVIVAVGSQFEPALNCTCMDYWDCAVGGGQIASYCGISETQVCCFKQNLSPRTLASKSISTINSRLKILPRPQNIATFSSQRKRSRHPKNRPEIATIGSAKEDEVTPCGISSSPALLDFRSQFAEWPWHVAILDSFSDLYLCGGTLLVSMDKIITGGSHCVVGYSNESNAVSKLKVRAGEHDVSGNFEEEHHVEISVQDIIVHPKFNRKTLENDIAILRLDHPFNFTRHIRPLCLPLPLPSHQTNRTRKGHSRRQQNYTNLNLTCVVTGWGRVSETSPMAHSIILKEVSVSLLSHGRCEQKLQTSFGSNYSLPLSSVCAVDYIIPSGGPNPPPPPPRVQICDGDGGGPLACRDSKTQKWMQHGIVSFGLGCGLGVYTRVASFIPWINANMDN